VFYRSSTEARNAKQTQITVNRNHVLNKTKPMTIRNQKQHLLEKQDQTEKKHSTHFTVTYINFLHLLCTGLIPKVDFGLDCCIMATFITTGRSNGVTKTSLTKKSLLYQA